MSATASDDFQRALCDLLVDFGAVRDQQLERGVREAVQRIESALAETSDDGTSLSALDVIRIRVNKLFARWVPATVYRDVPRRTAARARMDALARTWLGAENARGSWFGSTRERCTGPASNDGNS